MEPYSVTQDNQHSRKGLFSLSLPFSGSFHHMPYCCTFLFNGVYVLIAAPDSSCLSPK